MSKTISDISDLFMYALQLHGKASFPGLGTIFVYRKPASYAENRKKILPPETSLAFEKNIDDQVNVVKLGSSLGVQQEVLDNWSDSLNTFLDHRNEKEVTVFHLSGIGFLENESGSVRFKAEKEENHFNAFFGWPEINVTPLALDKNTIHFAVEQPKELIFPGKKKEKRNSPFIIPIILIGLVVSVLVIRLYNTDKPSPTSPVQSKPNTLINKENIIKESKSEPVTQEEIVLKDSTKQIVSSAATPSKVKIAEVKAEKTIQPAKISATPEKINKKPVSRNGECVYIAGAFTRQKNAVNLKNKLQKRGYQVEITKNNRFFRVGIWQPCQNDTSTQFQKLLTEFPDLWLLEE